MTVVHASSCIGTMHPPWAMSNPVMQFEQRLGLLNMDIESRNSMNSEWAHGVLDMEEAIDPEGLNLNEDPFEDPMLPKRQKYKRSIRHCLIRLIRRQDKITQAKNRFLHESAIRSKGQDPHRRTPWSTGGRRKDYYVDLL